MNKTEINWQVVAEDAFKSILNAEFIDECPILWEFKFSNSKILKPFEIKEFWEFFNPLIDKSELSPVVNFGLQNLYELSQLRWQLQNSFLNYNLKLSDLSFEQIAKSIVFSIAVYEELNKELQLKIKGSRLTRFGAYSVNQLLKNKSNKITRKLTNDDFYNIIEAWNFKKEELILEEIQAKLIYDRHYLLKDSELILNKILPQEIDFGVNDRIKKQIQKKVESIFNKTLVDSLDHFIINDAIYNTSNGPAMMVISKGEVVEHPKNVNFIKVEANTLEDFQENALKELFLQNLNVEYRKFTENYLFPISNLDFEETQILVNGIKIKFNHIRSICCLLHAISEISLQKGRNMDLLKVKNIIEDFATTAPFNFYDIPSMTDQIFNLNEYKNDLIISDYSIQEFMKITNQIHDLKGLSAEYIRLLLDFILQSKESFGVFIDSADHIWVIPSLIQRGNLIKHVYQRRVIFNLFNKKGKNGEIENNKTNRDKAMSSEIIQLFSNRGMFVKPEFEIRYINQEQKTITGKVDFLIYSEIENTFLVIELKKNNSEVFNSYGRWKWKNLHAPTINRQFSKYDEFFCSTEEGRKCIIENYGEKASTAEFAFILLTDNFNYDHEVFTKGQDVEQSISIITISLFELKILLDFFQEEKIHKFKNRVGLSIDSNRPINCILENLYNNTFWKKAIAELKPKFIQHLTIRTDPKFCLNE